MNKLLDLILYATTIPLICIGLYALLDAKLVSESAAVDSGLIEVAKVGGEELFEKIDENSEYVVAWLTIGDTNINYPVAQGENNIWFLSRNYKGEFATAGSIFLDYRNTPDFSDYFSIIYGHRMGNGEMFSDIRKFKDDSFFGDHNHGALRLRTGDLPLSVIAYAEVQADDWSIYNVERSRNDRAIALRILEQSELSLDDDGLGNYLLLSTCDGAEKNKRDVLLVRLSH